MQYLPEQVSSLHGFLKSTKNNSERERTLALLALSKGKKRCDAADIFEVNVATVDRWQTNFKRLGVKGIKNKGYIGNHYKLTRDQKEAVKEIVFKESPKELKLSVNRFWSVKSLARLVKEKYNVSFKSDSTYRKLFYSFGFSCHKPGKHNRNQRPKEVARFKVKVKKRLPRQEGWAVWYW